MTRDAYSLLPVKRLVWLTMILVLAGSAFAKSDIQSKYDKFKNITDTSTKPFVVHRGFGGLLLSFSYICPGDTDSCHPDTVFAVFDASTITGLYTKVHSVTFLADGARIVPVERESYDSDVVSDRMTTSVRETIIAQLSVADFLKIAKATNVEGEVGPTSFTVKDKGLELCQELAENIGTKSTMEKPMPSAVTTEPPKQLCTVSFKSTPDGADALVDGKYVGSTPSTVRLNDGDHSISIEKGGYKAWARTLTLTPGGNIMIDATLEKVP